MDLREAQRKIETDLTQADLIPLLQQTHERLGYIPEDAVARISELLGISQSQVYGVASFYSMFRFTEPGKCTVKVCMGTACHVRGSKNILDEFRRRLEIEPDQTTPDKIFTLETVNCLGACALGPIATFDGESHGLMKIKMVEELLGTFRVKYTIAAETTA